MSAFTFFDLMSAVRQIRPLTFREGYQDIIAYPLSVELVNRSATLWKITTDSDSGSFVFVWDQGNAGSVVISAVEGAPSRVVAHFGYFDVITAIRKRTTLKFTTGAVQTLAIPASLSNRSRSSQSFSIVTTNGSFTWADNNTSGPTTISEI